MYYTISAIIGFGGMYFSINSLRPRQNGRHFPDDTFKRIFLYENVRIAIKISLKFVLNGPINNCPSLVQMMAWCRPGDKPLSEPMMVRLLTHICVTRPQWVNKRNHFITKLFKYRSHTKWSDFIKMIYWIHKWHPIAHPLGQVMGVYLRWFFFFFRKLTAL